MFFMKSIVNHKRKDSFGRRSLSFFLGRKLGNRFLKQIGISATTENSERKYEKLLVSTSETN